MLITHTSISTSKDERKKNCDSFSINLVELSIM